MSRIAKKIAMAPVPDVASTLQILDHAIHSVISELRKINEPDGEITLIIIELKAMRALSQRITGSGRFTSSANAITAPNPRTVEEAIRQAGRIVAEARTLAKDFRRLDDHLPLRVLWTRQSFQVVQLRRQTRDLRLSMMLLATTGRFMDKFDIDSAYSSFTEIVTRTAKEEAEQYDGLTIKDLMRLEAAKRRTPSTSQLGLLRVGVTSPPHVDWAPRHTYRQPQWLRYVFGNLSITIEKRSTRPRVVGITDFVESRARFILPLWLVRAHVDVVCIKGPGGLSLYFDIARTLVPTRPIWRAVRQGNVDWLVQELSRSSENGLSLYARLINESNGCSISLLSYAIECSQPRITKALMDAFGGSSFAGPEPQLRAPDCAAHKLLFHSMASLEELRVLKEVAAYQEDYGSSLFQVSSVNGDTASASGPHGYLPIHRATVDGDFEVFAHLRESGADVDSPDVFGNTPLHLVVKTLEFEQRMAESLLAAGAAIDKQDLLGRTPLHSALARACLESVRLLLKHGANPNIRESLFGETPLNFLVSKYPVCSTDHDILELLCAQGADLEIPDYDGSTPVMNAVKNPGGTAFFKSLVGKGALLHKTDGTGKSIFDMAVVWADAELINHMGVLGLIAPAYDDAKKSLRYLESRTPMSTWCTTRCRGDSGEEALVRLMRNDSFALSSDSRAIEKQHVAAVTSSLEVEKYEVLPISPDEGGSSEMRSGEETFVTDKIDSSTDESYAASDSSTAPPTAEHTRKLREDPFWEVTVPSHHGQITTASSFTKFSDPGSLQSQLKDFISILDADMEFQSLLDSAAKNSFISLPSFEQFLNFGFTRFGIDFSHEHRNQPDVAAFLLRYSYVISSTIVLSTIQQADVTSSIKRGLMTNRAAPGEDVAFDDTLPANWLLEIMAEEDTQLKQGKKEPHQSLFHPQDQVPSSVDANVVGVVDFKTADLQNLVISSHAFRSLRHRFRRFLCPEFFQAAMDYLRRFDIADMERYDANLRYRLTSLVVELSHLRPRKLDIGFHGGTTKLDAIKLATEDLTDMPWSWWPLRKPRRPLKVGQVRLSWICECGRKRAENVPQRFGRFLEILVRQQNTSGGPSDNDESSQSPTNPIPTVDPTTSLHSQDANDVEEQATDIFSNEKTTGASNRHSLGVHGSGEKWIFLMAKSGRLSLHQIDAKAHSDETFADELRKGYSRLRGWWRFRFGINVFSHCDFVKFEKYVSERYSNRGIGVPNSEPHIKEYYFQPRPGDKWFAEPPISPEHFRHVYYDCAGHNASIIAQPLQGGGNRDDSIIRKATKRLPSLFAPRRHGRFPPKTVSKIPQRLSYFDEKGESEEYLWGLLAREERSAVRVCLWAVAIFTPSIAFSFIYLFGFGGMNVDLQNATSLFVISLTIFCTFISFLLKDGKRVNGRL